MRQRAVENRLLLLLPLIGNCILNSRFRGLRRIYSGNETLYIELCDAGQASWNSLHNPISHLFLWVNAFSALLRHITDGASHLHTGNRRVCQKISLHSAEFLNYKTTLTGCSKGIRLRVIITCSWRWSKTFAAAKLQIVTRWEQLWHGLISTQQKSSSHHVINISLVVDTVRKGMEKQYN